MDDKTLDHVVIATRFSRLRPRMPAGWLPPIADLQDEALSALAESLDLLAQSLLPRQCVGNGVARRLHRLQERVSTLTSWATRQSETRSDADASDSAASAAALRHVAPSRLAPTP
jgi:hypothetical protein